MTTNPALGEADFTRRASENQAERAAEIKPAYDFIVCGAGAAGSVVARCLAENPVCTELPPSE